MERWDKNFMECDYGIVQEVRKLYQLDKPGDMDNAIDILENWIMKQQHFIKKNYSRSYLELTILLSKGSIERAKTRMDKRCTFKTLMPQFFGNFDVRNDFKELDAMKFTVLPKLTENHLRTLLIRCETKNPAPSFLLKSFRLVLMGAEFLLWYPEYTSGYMIVLDIVDFDIGGLLKIMNINELRHGATIFVDGYYGAKMKGIHVLSKSKFTEIILKIGKRASEKLSKRIHFHQSLETLYDFIPKHTLPKDYGGEERTLEEHHESWIDAMSTEEFRAYMNEASAACTDESLRDTATFNEQYMDYMGTHGTFRNFSID